MTPSEYEFYPMLVYSKSVKRLLETLYFIQGKVVGLFFDLFVLLQSEGSHGG